MTNPDVLVVLSTFPDRESAARVTRELVAEKLVACGQVESSAVRSFYVWEDELQDDEEVLVRLKTAPERLEWLRRRFEELHPYEVPQFVVLEAGASEAYTNWLRQQCGLEGAPPDPS